MSAIPGDNAANSEPKHYLRLEARFRKGKEIRYNISIPLLCNAEQLNDDLTTMHFTRNQGPVIRPMLACKVKKGKAIPSQALTGPKGSRSLRLPDFKTNGT
jgi:hypothetical protein